MDTTAHDLKILSICHYILGGFHAVMGLVMLAYGLFLGAIFSSMPASQAGAQSLPPAFLNVMMAVFVVLALLVAGYSVCILLGGRFLSQHRHYGFCFAVAVLNCLAIPFGTTLAIFTFLVLSRPQARSLFGTSTPVNFAVSQLPPPLPVSPVEREQIAD